MTKTYYKCCTVNEDGDLVSIVAQGKIAVTYQEGKWVSPNAPGTKLMVFDNIGDARRFCRSSARYAIYECNIVNGTSQVPETFLDYTVVMGWFLWQSNYNIWFDLLLRKKNKKKYRKDYDDLRAEYSISSVPDGTIFCDEVKLTKRIS